jgi:FtsP/CotA-like multicopper oxidase with cupredoxin domain
MATIVEYANRSSGPQWQQPSDLIWNYEQFAAAAGADSPRAEPPSNDARSADAPIVIPLVFESKFRGHGAMEAWTINGKSYPDTSVAPLQAGQRYRLQFINKSSDDHPLHLHRHSFELHRIGAPLGAAPQSAGSASRPSPRGIIKDVLLVDALTQSEVDFTADHPGATLFHCHQQNHMDLGFMMLFHYA